MLEGQKRKSARISALEESNRKKREENKNLNTQQQQKQEQVGEACQPNAAPPAPPPPPLLQGSGSEQPLPEPRRGRKKKRLDEVAVSFSAPTIQQDGDKPKQEDAPISNATLPSVQRMPEKRILEFILDILQRRDTHEIFAQPVDPKEVEGYYDIIEKPMDFGTMRAKLQEGLYTTLEQFENDVFLISSNAMHFNSSATIYFRQARAIHELAKRVFNTLKTDPQKIEDGFVQTRRRGRKPRGETGGSRTKLVNNLGRNLGAYRGSSSSNLLVDHRGIEILPGTERRQTYKLGASLLGQNEPIVSTVYNCPKQLVPDNGGVRYKESLMQFVKDLGPTAQMVANRKLSCLEALNYQSQTASRANQSQTPSHSVQYPNYLISSPASKGGLTCMDSAINNQMPRIRSGIQDAAARGKNVLTGDLTDIHGGSYTDKMVLGRGRMGVHGAASKGKGILIGEGMDMFSRASGGKMSLPSGWMDIQGPASKGKNVLIGDGMDIHGGSCGGRRLDIHGSYKGKNVLAGNSTDIFDGTRGGKMMTDAMDVYRGAYKEKNVLTSDLMNIYDGICREKMTLANANSRAAIQDAASKWKNVEAGESMGICKSAFGGEMHLSRDKAAGHDAFQEAMAPPVDIMGIRIQGERAHGPNRMAINGSLLGGMAVNTLGMRNTREPSGGLNQPSDERVFLQALGEDVARPNQHTQNLLGLNFSNAGLEGLSSPGGGIREASSTYFMDLLQIGTRESSQNQNMQNHLVPYLRSFGTTNLINPSAGIKDTSKMMHDQIHPVQLPSESRSRSQDFMFRGNQHPRSTVYPSTFIKPSCSGQTSTLMGQTNALPSHNYGANSTQASQAAEWTQPMPWGSQVLHDFSETQPRLDEVNLLGKNALVQQELQFLLGDQNGHMQRQGQLASIPSMQTQASELDPLGGQAAFVPQQSQLASGSFLQPLPTEVNLLQGQDAFTQEAQPSANPLGENVYMQQDPQVAFAQYMQQQPPELDCLNLSGEAAFLRQETHFTVPPEGQMLDADNFCLGEGAGTDAQSIWDHPDLDLQL